jgi:hypothetical protein
VNELLLEGREGTGKEVAVRFLLLIAVAGLLASCAKDVMMLNPRTGESAACPASPLNPWSQQDACIGDYIAQGWRRLEPP